jgi:hypothetical protein
MPTHRLLLIPCLALLLGGCVVAPYPHRGVYSQPVPSYDPRYDSGGAVVDYAPPAPLVEVIPAIPFAGAVWIGGHWGWHGGRHHWNHGRWDHPRHGHAYRQHGWSNHGGRWHERRGGWHRRN